MHHIDDWCVAPLIKLYGLLRVQQWVKNVLVLAPAFFAGTLSAPGTMASVGIAALLFSLTASLVYIINDIRDQEVDVKHPIKRLRPIASGHVSEKEGLAVAVVLAGVVVAGLVWMPALIIPLGAYVVINGLYSFWLKHVPVLDVVLVAASHVLRLLVGGIAAVVLLSPWIVLCTFFGALFLVTAKRRGELSRESRRKVFEYYTAAVLDGMAGVAVAGALIAYALYAVVGAPFAGAEYSVIFVATALLRMFMRVLRGEAAAEFPEKLIFKDRVVLLSTALWIAYMGFLIYTHTL
jgi:4-hydroxybenzoate polyprenyltransferase